MKYPQNPRRLKRGDVVHERNVNVYIIYGRVWRRYDENHVIVIDCGTHIQVYHEDELVLSDYKGMWDWNREPGNPYGKKPKWIPMTSLKSLKRLARPYNASFGGHGSWGRWTKQERLEALRNPRRWKPAQNQ